MANLNTAASCQALVRIYVAMPCDQKVLIGKYYEGYSLLFLEGSNLLSWPLAAVDRPLPGGDLSGAVAVSSVDPGFDGVFVA